MYYYNNVPSYGFKRKVLILQRVCELLVVFGIWVINERKDFQKVEQTFFQ